MIMIMRERCRKNKFKERANLNLLMVEYARVIINTIKGMGKENITQRMGTLMRATGIMI